MVPAELRGRAQWLIWRFEKNPKKPEGKPLKVPYWANGKKRMGTQGGETDRANLATFDTAVAAQSRLNFDGIGFAFLPDDGLIGIDLDKMIDADGVVSERCQAIIRNCNSYTEYSPSRTGVHIIVLGSTTTNKFDPIGVEIFCNAQYFTFTGEHYAGTPQTVNAIDAAVLRRLHATVNKAKKAAKAPPAGAPGVQPIAGGAKTSRLENDFHKVNDAALHNLAAWVPAIFPAAAPSAKGYRVSSRDLGRDLEEDLSITSDGIVDFGVADQGDAREGRRTAIDLVIEWGRAASPKEALHWLAAQLGMSLAGRGSQSAGTSDKPGTARNPREKGATQGEVAGDAPPDDGPPDDEPPDYGGPDDPAHGLPLIRWANGRLPEIVNQAEDALIQAQTAIYQRASTLVRVVRRDTPSIRNYKRPAGMLGLHHVDQSDLVEEFTRVARWEKFDSRAKDWRRINAPKDVAATYLARVGRWHVPRLWSVISAPTLRPDGSVLQKPGYDADTGTWYGPGETRFPKIPDSPTRDDALAALELLQETFGSFPCETEVDRAVLISLVLTGLVRRSLPTAPIGGITAPDAATGKTLLASAVSLLATGADVPMISYPESDEEAAKTALAVLYEGDAVVLLDNVTRPLQGDWLCSILTSESFRQRVLGRTEMITVPTTTQWLATGNQLVFEGDLALRALMCRLDAKCERPDTRVFPGDLRIELLEKRPQLVVAGLTVMRAFIAQGERMADYCTPWGRFEHWSEMVRAPLIWLGIPDPCESRAAITGNDPKRDALARLLSAWWKSFKGEARTAIEAVRHAGEHTSVAGVDAMAAVLVDICQDRDKSFNSKKLGMWLARHVGRRVDGMHIVKHGKDENGSWRWILINAKGGD